MYPGIFGWMKRGGCGHGWGHHAGQSCCEPDEACAPRSFGPRHFGGHGPPMGRGGGEWDGDGGGGFGVRRPLRFLAWKLELDDAQVAKLAAILDALKIERAQAAVDQRRTLAAFADAVAAEAFDAARAKEAADARSTSASRLNDAVGKALASIHAMLNAEQRQHFAYLLRTGALSM